MTRGSKPRRGGRRRANGEGTIYKVETPAGIRWEPKFYDEGGKRVKWRFSTEREGRAALDAARQLQDKGLPALQAKHTMAQLFNAWLMDLRARVDRGERSLNTLREYESYVRQHMRPALGAIECRRLTVNDVEHYLASLQLAPKTRANHRIARHRALNVALKWRWLEQNVAGRTDPITVQRRQVGAVSSANAQRLLDTLKQDALYSPYAVALFTGLRAGELTGLRIEDVDLEGATARIHQ